MSLKSEWTPLKLTIFKHFKSRDPPNRIKGTTDRKFGTICYFENIV